jgi:hypothetical protein
MVLPHAALWLEIRTYLINPGLASGVRLTSRWLGPTSPDLASWLDSAPLGTSCQPSTMPELVNGYPVVNSPSALTVALIRLR